MTAAEIRKAIAVAEERYHGVHAIAVVTAGVVNAVMAGELLPDSTVRKLTKPGTINIVVAVDAPLEPEGCANAIITATEAKSAAMFERGIRGTGTTSDAVAIVSPLGKGTKYAGTATDVGIAIARAVRKATSESIRKWKLVNPPMDFLSLLERKGVTIDDLWAMAIKLPPRSLLGPGGPTSKVRGKPGYAQGGRQRQLTGSGGRAHGGRGIS